MAIANYSVRVARERLSIALAILAVDSGRMHTEGRGREDTLTTIRGHRFARLFWLFEWASSRKLLHKRVP